MYVFIKKDLRKFFHADNPKAYALEITLEFLIDNYEYIINEICLPDEVDKHVLVGDWAFNVTNQKARPFMKTGSKKS